MIQKLICNYDSGTAGFIAAIGAIVLFGIFYFFGQCCCALTEGQKMRNTLTPAQWKKCWEEWERNRLK
jgi:hypothetical protein